MEETAVTQMSIEAGFGLGVDFVSAISSPTSSPLTAGESDLQELV